MTSSVSITTQVDEKFNRALSETLTKLVNTPPKNYSYKPVGCPMYERGMRWCKRCNKFRPAKNGQLFCGDCGCRMRSKPKVSKYRHRYLQRVAGEKKKVLRL